MTEKFKVYRVHDDDPDEEWHIDDEWVDVGKGTAYDDREDAEAVADDVRGGDDIEVRPIEVEDYDDDDHEIGDEGYPDDL